MIEEMEKDLLPLNRFEVIGKQHLQKYEKNMSSAQFIYCMNYPDSVLGPDDLYTPQAIAEQRRVAAAIRPQGGDLLLHADRFISGGKNFEIEKNLRYVDIPPHQHDFIELSYVACGRCTHRVNGVDHVQEVGSFTIIPERYTHTLFSEEDCLCMSIKVRLNIYRESEFLDADYLVHPMMFPCGTDKFIRDSIAELWLQQTKRRPYSDCIIEHVFMSMMYYIRQNFRDMAQYLITNSSFNPRIIEILGYMLENYRTVTLASVAEHFHYNPAYLSRMFHEQVGSNFSQIIKEYRVRRAARMLSEGRCKLNDVCEAVGYKDPAQFTHSFKRLYGITPAKYCRQMGAGNSPAENKTEGQK